MRILNIFLTAAAAASVLLSCSKDPGQKDDPKEEEEQKVIPLNPGSTTFEYTGYKPLKSYPVTVFVYIPEGFDMKTMPVLFAMHGASRDGANQVKYWKSTANAKGVIVVAPQFSKQVFENLKYQLGGVSNSNKEYIPNMTERWSYNIIESLFDYVKKATGNTSQTYYLQGHSAGGQWTHRFLLNMKSHRCAKAVECNAGYYTVPDPNGISDGNYTYGFPYSVKGMFYEDADIKYPLDKYDYMTIDQLKKYLGLDLTVHLGTADTVTSAEVDENLPVTAGAEAQGRCRFERGHFFYDRARRVADSLGCPFNWKLVEVPGVGHSANSMVNASKVGAATILFGN